MLLWAKNRTTGGEKGFPVSQGRKIVSQCCFEPKKEPQEENKVGLGSQGGEKGFPVLLRARNRTSGGEKGFPVSQGEEKGFPVLLWAKNRITGEENGFQKFSQWS